MQVTHQGTAPGRAESDVYHCLVGNKGLLGEGKIEHFYPDVGRIIGNFHFSIVLMGTLGVNISS